MFRKRPAALKLPHNKNTACMASERIAPPKEVFLPTLMHAGSPAVPIVRPGDRVCVGQMVAREEGRFSSPVHASVSGTVVAVEPFGQGAQIRIESDGLMERHPSVQPPKVSDLDTFLQAVRESGIVGLGGGAFPLWAKLDAVRTSEIRTVLINGAECEPYITSDTRTMLERGADVVKGVEWLKEYLGAREFILGIEGNKPEAITAMRHAFEGDPTVKVLELPARYPQGAKQVLLYNATGKVVREGQRLASLGVIIINVTSLAKMARYMEDGMPLVSRCVTVDGSAIRRPCNLVAPVGTPVGWLIERAGGLREEPERIILGGPMMGRPATGLSEPILKATNAVLALSGRESHRAEPTNCIRCGRCVEACPLGLNPATIDRAVERRDAASLAAERVQLCVECGCCAYICPAHRPLVETNRRGMRLLRESQSREEERR